MPASTEHPDIGLALNGTRVCVTRIIPTDKFTIVNPNNELMCGGLGHKLELMSAGIEIHGFRCMLEPHPGELEIIVPLLGYTELSDVYTPTDALTYFTSLMKLKTSSDQVVITYGDCLVNRAIFRGQKGLHPVSVELDIWARTYAEGATFSPSTVTEQAPYAFTAGALSLAGSATPFSQFVWVRDNNLARRFNNSVTADVIVPTERTVHFGVNTPYVDATDGLLTTATGASRMTGIAGELTYTNGTKRLIFTHTKLVWPDASPPPIGPKPEEIRMFQFYQAVENGVNPDHTITQDNT